MTNTAAQVEKADRIARAVAAGGLMLVPVLILMVHLLLVYRA
jgi:hypothetical protein